MGLCHAVPAAAKPKNDPAAQTAPQAPAPPTTPTKPKIVPGSDPGGVAVAIIGTGVNYTLPQIANRLARDGEGDIIGLDFIDRDNRPFDRGPDLAPAPFGASPMGTTPASLILAEAPRARLVPVRALVSDPRQLGGAAAFVAAPPARIVLVAFTSPNRAGWESFERAAKAAPNVLFVLPAGDANQDLDQHPLFPARLDLPNAVVVTAASADGLILPDANSGVRSVDVAVSAHDALALAQDGSTVKVSGSLYAASRVAALAARLLEVDRGLTVAGINAQLAAVAIPTRGDVKMRTRLGWIARPEAVTLGSKP